MKNLSALIVCLCFYSCTVIHWDPVSRAHADPATQPATAPVTQPAIPPANFTQQDFGRQLATLKPGGYVKFTPGLYEITDTEYLGKPGTYDGTGVTLRTRHGTLIWTTGPNITLIGMTLDSDFPAVLPSGQNPKVNVSGIIDASKNLSVVNFTFRNLDNCVQLFPGQRGLVLVNPHWTDEIRADAIYLGGGDETVARGDVTIQGGIIENSQQEQNIRGSTLGFVGLHCYGTVFRATNGKEMMGFRIGHQLECNDCIFYGTYPTFLGEGNPQDLARCGDIVFRRCTFVDGPVVVRFARDVQVLDCHFWIDGPPIQVSDGANVTVKNLMRFSAVTTFDPKKQQSLYWQDTTPTKKMVVDLGGHMTAPPTTRPVYVAPGR